MYNNIIIYIYGLIIIGNEYIIKFNPIYIKY